MGIKLSGSVSIDGKMIKEAGKTIDKGVKTAKKGINKAKKKARKAAKTAETATKIAEKRAKGAVENYADQRLGRVNTMLDKLGEGRVLDAAVDGLQFITHGSRIADAATALGFVEEKDKHVLSGIVNILTPSFLVKLAALADAEDALQANLPELQKTATQAEQLGTVPPQATAGCAGPGYVPSPTVQVAKRARVPGYPERRGPVDVEGFAKSRKFEELIAKRGKHPAVSDSFGRDIPAIIRTLEDRGAFGLSDDVSVSGDRLPPPATGGASGSNMTSSEVDNSLATILKDPSLSFEDKLFLFMLALAKKQEDKVEELMKQHDKDSAATEKGKEIKSGGMPGMSGGGGATASGGDAGGGSPLTGIVDFAKSQGPNILRTAGSIAGIAAPIVGTIAGAAVGAVGFGVVSIPGSALGGAIGGIVGAGAGLGANMLADGIESGALDGAFDAIGGGGGGSAEAQSGAPSIPGGKASGAASSPKTDKEKEASDQQAMMVLQKETQKLQQMYSMVTNLLKVFHDSGMAAIRNMR